MEYTVHKTEYLDEQGLEDLWEKIKTYVSEHSGSGSGSIDLTDYATKEYVTEAINAIDVDLSDYVVAENLATTLLDYAAKNHTHSEYLTEHQDISGKSDVGHKHVKADITDYTEPDLSNYATKDEIPDMANYATQDYVTEQIANASLGGGSVDLTVYAKKTDVDTALAGKAEKEHTHTLSEISDYTVPDLTGYATETYVQKQINAIPSTDLTNYYTKDETYNKEEIDNKISSGDGSGSSSGSTDLYSTDEVVIGTWVDGKKIYRKVVHRDVGNVSFGSRSSLTFDGFTIDTCISSKLILILNSSNTALKTIQIVEGAYIDSFVSSASSASTLLTNIKNEMIYVNCAPTKAYYYVGSNFKNTDSELYIILEYTKE